jgi:two-component system phosphate regulon sensor histidine kinase PhoR
MKKESPLRRRFFFYYSFPVLIGLWLAGFSLLGQAGRLSQVLFSILIVIALGVLDWGISRAVIQPLGEIRDIVKKFSEGLFNWRVHLQYRGDEFGELGNELNRLAEATQGKISGLSLNLAESRALLAGMEEGVLILDLKGRVQKINEAMETHIFSLSPSDVGKHYLEVFRDPGLNDLIQATLASKQGQRRSLALLGQPGRFYHVQSSLIQDPESGAGGIIAVFHDVTDLKRLERVRQEFVANVSHELRTPLTAIKGYVEALLDDGLGNPAQAGQFLRVIDRNASRMDKIVSDLLLLSELESPNWVLRKEAISIAESIHSSVEALRSLAESKRQAIQLRIPPQLPSMVGDGQKIQQVFLNLLHNAINYTPEGGQISIEARVHPQGVEVAVSDTGIGIPAEDLPRIFERFYRVDKGRSRELGGTGLGLSIVKHIVEAHGGRVSVESKPGQGSRFSLFLPKA